MSRFEIQVTVTDTQIGKMIFDRKGVVETLSAVGSGIAELAHDFVDTAQSDQSRQEIQYNETRPAPPTIARGDEIYVTKDPELAMRHQIVTGPDGRRYQVVLDPVWDTRPIEQISVDVVPVDAEGARRDLIAHLQEDGDD
jgi:hypothetical protein